MAGCERRRGGLGIGLTLTSVARRASRGHGRSAQRWYRQRQWQFEVCLPLLKGVRKTTEKKAGAKAPAKVTDEGRRILIVNDNADTAQSLRDAAEADEA